jgi:hypothetical protein
MEIILSILILIPLLVIYQSFAWGYVALIIYNWFLLPTFTTLPVLTWQELAGIMFFINCFVHNTTTAYIKDEYKDSKGGLTISILAPWLTLLGAWIFKIILF